MFQISSPTVSSGRTLIAKRICTAVVAFAALGAAAVAPCASAQSNTAPPAAAAQVPGYYRLNLDDAQLSVINDGFITRKIEGYIPNASVTDVREALDSARYPLANDMFPVSINALLLRDANGVTLFDTGLTGVLATTGLAAANIELAGARRSEVTAVLITHFHNDHINGLIDRNGAPQYPNAKIYVPEPEWAFWMDPAKTASAPDAVKAFAANARRVFSALGPNVVKFKPGAEVIPGVLSIPSVGHTPGHTSFLIRDKVLVLGDAASVPALFTHHLDWVLASDLDRPAAVEARRRLLARAAKDRLTVFFTHGPFPALYSIVEENGAYDAKPVFWNSAP